MWAKRFCAGRLVVFFSAICKNISDGRGSEAVVAWNQERQGKSAICEKATQDGRGGGCEMTKPLVPPFDVITGSYVAGANKFLSWVKR